MTLAKPRPSGSRIFLNWNGGLLPHVLQVRDRLVDDNWEDVGELIFPNTLTPHSDESRYFRVKQP